MLCLGEALVDFVCPQPVPDLAAAPHFVPRFGGSQANVAVGAARFGAEASLAGGVGEDAWGRWLLEKLREEGVDTGLLPAVPGGATPHTFVALSATGEPAFAFFEGCRSAAVAASGGALAEAIGRGVGVLSFGSDTLIEAGEREVTIATAEAARAAGWEVVYDPNLRPARWAGAEEAAAAARLPLATATVVKVNRDELAALAGRAGAAAGIEALREAGAGRIVVTAGAGGILLAEPGGDPVQLDAEPAGPARDATGAGDSVTAVLAAFLAAAPPGAGLAPALELAAATAAAVVGEVGSVAGLPPRRQATAALRAAVALAG